MKRLIRLITLLALTLMLVSSGTHAWSGTVTSISPTGEVTTIHKDPVTGAKTVTLPNGGVITKEPNGNGGSSDTTSGDVISTPVVTSTVIQPTMITIISGGMSGGGGDIGSSASGQAHELEEVVLEDSSWIEDGVAFWKDREKNKGKQL